MTKILIFIFCVILAFIPALGDIEPIVSELPQVIALSVFTLLFVLIPFASPIRISMADIILAAWVFYQIVSAAVLDIPLDPIDACFAVSSILIYLSFKHSRVSTLDAVIQALVVSGMIQSVICYLQLSGLFASNHSAFSITGSFFNPGPLAGFLTPIFFLNLYVIKHIATRKSMKIVWGVALLIIASVVIMSGSRAACVAILTGIGIAVFPAIKRALTGKMARSKTGKTFISLTILTAGVAAIIFSIWLYDINRDSIRGRILIWKIALTEDPTNAVTGEGPRSFERTYMYRQASYFSKSLRVSSLTTSNPTASAARAKEALLADNTHFAFNEPIRIYYEQGAVGLTLALAFFALLLARPLRLRQNPRSVYSALAILSLLVFSMFSYPSSILSIRLLFVVLVAVLLSSGGYKSILNVNLIWAKRVRVASLIAATTMLCAGVYLLTYFVPARAELKKLCYQSTDIGYEAIASAHKYLSDNHEWTLYYGGLLYAHQMNSEAFPVLYHGALLHPSSQLFGTIAECYHQSGDEFSAEEWFKLSVNATPGYITPLLRMWDFYDETDQIDKALQTARRITNQEFKVLNSTVINARARAREYIIYADPDIEEAGMRAVSGQ